MTDRLLTTAEAAKLIGYAPGTLENMRVSGNGPQYIQRTRRGRVRYFESDLLAWVKSSVKTRTSE